MIPPDDQLNHVQLVVIMLLTITLCMVFVLIGFCLVRRRLSSQLPFQTEEHNEKAKRKFLVNYFKASGVIIYLAIEKI